MMLMSIAAVGAAWLLGVLTVIALWPRKQPWSPDLPLILPLGLGVGLGATSALFFAASLMTSRPVAISAGMEILAGIGLAWCCSRRCPPDPASATSAAKGSVMAAVAASVFAQACFVCLVVAARAYAAEPYGSWDGWAIWNMHARIMFRGGETWSSLMSFRQLGWTHLDYPLLMPASIARAWAYAGQDTAFAAGLISTLFGVATIALLVGAVARMRHRLIAFAGGLTLIGTPFFVTFSSNEHADIPLGFFILATVVLITVGGRQPEGWGWPALAGITAGLAAWTKNEGLLLVAVVGLFFGLRGFVRSSWRAPGAFFAGLAVALLPVVYFKAVLAPSNDIMTDQLAGHLGRLFDSSRHSLILSSLRRDAMGFGEWRFVPFLALVLPLIGPGWRRLHSREWAAAAVPGLMLAGYYCVYLLSPWDLLWHLNSSLVRLLLQLWPAGLFFWCLVAAGAEAAPPSAGDQPVARSRTRVPLFLLANVAVATGVLALLARQPAPGELAAARIDRAAVSVMIGEGWFGEEQYRRDTWRWSRGEARLAVNVAAGRKTTPITLRFSLRSLDERMVTVKMNDRMVWQGRVGNRFSAVTITGLALSPGTTEIVFTTDQLGVPEPASRGARALAYALYNLRVE